jgi:hypothetical protein
MGPQSHNIGVTQKVGIDYVEKWSYTSGSIVPRDCMICGAPYARGFTRSARISPRYAINHLKTVSSLRRSARFFTHGPREHRNRAERLEAMSDIVPAADVVIDRCFDLPLGYRATFIWRCPFGPLEGCWSPDQPCIRRPRPRRKFLEAYQAARRKDLAVLVGGTVLVVDTDLKTVSGHEVIVPRTQH